MKRDLFQELMQGFDALRESRWRPKNGAVSNDSAKELPTHRVDVESLESALDGLKRGSKNGL